MVPRPLVAIATVEEYQTMEFLVQRGLPEQCVDLTMSRFDFGVRERSQRVGTLRQRLDIGEPPIFEPPGRQPKTPESFESRLTQFDQPCRRGSPLHRGVLILIR